MRWQEASEWAIADPLKQGGISPTKSRGIRTICKRIKAAFGKATLARLSM